MVPKNFSPNISQSFAIPCSDAQSLSCSSAVLTKSLSCSGNFCYCAGAERFSDYEGYAHTFRWAGNHVDQITR